MSVETMIRCDKCHEPTSGIRNRIRFGRTNEAKGAKERELMLRVFDLCLPCFNLLIGDLPIRDDRRKSALDPW